MGTEPRRDFPGVPFDSKAPEAVPSPEAASPFALRIAQVRPQLLWAPLLPWGPLHQWLCLRNPSGLTPPSPTTHRCTGWHTCWGHREWRAVKAAPREGEQLPWDSPFSARLLYRVGGGRKEVLR